MELRSRNLAEVEVEVRDPDPGVHGPSSLRTPIAEFPQMLGATGAVDNPDVYAECDVALEAGPEARPTQPPHPQRIADAEDLELYGSPDTVNIEDILNVDVTPLSAISTSVSDMSVAMSVDRVTLTTVDFDDRDREMQDIATRSELDDTAIGASCFRNPSCVAADMFPGS